jgi:hypothetical protein
MTNTINLTSTFELSTTCTCENYDEETGETTDSEFCYGCWEDEKSNLQYSIIEPWLAEQTIDSNDLLRINGSNMGWLHTSGWTYCPPTVDGILNALSINSDYTLRFTLEGTNLTVIRSSHDEFAARFDITVQPISAESDDWA